MDNKKYKILLLITWSSAFSIGLLISPTSFKSPNIWTFLPIILLYLTILITKNFYISFFLGTLLAFIFTDKHLSFFCYVNSLIDVCSDKNNIWLLLDIFLIGSLINIIRKSDFINVISDFFTENKIGKKTLNFIFLMSAFLSFDDYFFPSMISSAFDRENNTRFNDKNLIAFLSRGATISFANYNPISWPIYTMGLLVNSGIADVENAYFIYYKISIFIFFPIILIFLLYVQNQRLAEYSKKSSKDNAKITWKNKKLMTSIISFFLPIIFHMIFSIIIGDTLPSLFLTVVLTSVLYVLEKKFTFLEIPNIVISGCKNMFEVCLIIILSLVFSEAISNINFTEHTIAIISGVAQPQLFPFAVFVLFSIIEYFFSLNWTLWLIIFPVLIRVCTLINAPLYLTLGAILSAGILGSISCVYSDSSVLSINCFSLDIRFHAKYTLVHVFPAFCMSALLYLICGLIY